MPTSSLYFKIGLFIDPIYTSPFRKIENTKGKIRKKQKHAYNSKKTELTPVLFLVYHLLNWMPEYLWSSCSFFCTNTREESLSMIIPVKHSLHSLPSFTSLFHFHRELLFSLHSLRFRHCSASQYCALGISVRNSTWALAGSCTEIGRCSPGDC